MGHTGGEHLCGTYGGATLYDIPGERFRRGYRNLYRAHRGGESLYDTKTNTFRLNEFFPL